MSESCQKLASTHPIVVLRSGLKNNWIKTLDSVNRPENITLPVTFCCEYSVPVSYHFFRNR